MSFACGNRNLQLIQNQDSVLKVDTEYVLEVKVSNLARKQYAGSGILVMNAE